MSEQREQDEKASSDVHALENLDTDEFRTFLCCSIGELMERAWVEQWKVKHVEFWLKVKNAQNIESISSCLESISTWNDRRSEEP
ncbi:MAG TPA: hypothetical protein VN368_02905 [Candidatus Methylomirabilis sp.]|nr:hypothetical protein [Candidatus Methylomirabilis sp.]